MGFCRLPCRGGGVTLDPPDGSPSLRPLMLRLRSRRGDHGRDGMGSVQQANPSASLSRGRAARAPAPADASACRARARKRGRHEQRQHGFAQHPADDARANPLPGAGPRAGAARQGQAVQDEGERGHQDRAESQTHRRKRRLGRLSPSAWRRAANSKIRTEFFADSPTRVMRPTWK